MANERSRTLGVCHHCGWWYVQKNMLDMYESTFPNMFLYFGGMQEYAVDSLEIPFNDLRRHLIQHPNNVAHVDPRLFEILMTRCLRSAYQDAEVTHVGKTADGGVDIKLVTAHNEIWLVQVKRRGDLTKKESVRVVRELNGVLFREGLAKGMVITTARDYSNAAIKEAHSIKTKTVDRYEVRLLNFTDILSMLRMTIPDRYVPWVDNGLWLESSGS